METRMKAGSRRERSQALKIQTLFVKVRVFQKMGDKGMLKI